MAEYCENCKHKELKHKFDKWPCMDCFGGDRREPVTNADRIRAMTDEDLAIFLDDVQKYNIVCKPIIADDCADCMTDLCWRCWVDWLKQEASDECT